MHKNIGTLHIGAAPIFLLVSVCHYKICMRSDASNSSWISLLGSWSNKLTTKIAMVDKIKPGTISYKPNQPNCFHTRTVIPPTKIPAIHPFRVMRFQIKEIKIAGPKAAPNPAHA